MGEGGAEAPAGQEDRSAACAGAKPHSCLLANRAEKLHHTQGQAWNPLCPGTPTPHRQPLTTKGGCSPSEASAAAGRGQWPEFPDSCSKFPSSHAVPADSLQAPSKLPAAGR